ncbi:outer dense fiber protein 3-B [Ischnura elegans]|uniref:outer dense fiber protein 3-B n=1 Tax=Ischnura elegans TaxID=197161 RepID=UPI001ED8A90A|nr:outer dense fiber protein 3-B [Ischnura elegans]
MARQTGPGPGVYLMPPTVGYEGHDFTRHRNPAYSIGIKPQALRKFAVPGPMYIEPGTTRFGPPNKNPGYSIASKPPIVKGFSTPGPATYSPDAYAGGVRPPAFSIAGRYDIRRKDISPGPNAYAMPSTIGNRVPDKPTSAAFSIASRPHVLTRHQTPGPAAYEPPNLHVYKERSPGYTIAGRNRILGERTPKPGPNAYFPSYKTYQRSPEFSFGVKHSEYEAPFKLKDEC